MAERFPLPGGGGASPLFCSACNSGGHSNFTCPTCCKEMLLDGRISLNDYNLLTIRQPIIDEPDEPPTRVVDDEEAGLYLPPYLQSDPRDYDDRDE